MAVLSSRPAPSTVPTQQEVLDAARPAVNLVIWLSGMIRYPDDSIAAVRGGLQTIEDALECLMLPEVAVMALPGTMNTLVYNVAVRPLPNGPFVGWHASFKIQP
jgi:hypothetical protein